MRQVEIWPAGNDDAGATVRVYGIANPGSPVLLERARLPEVGTRQRHARVEGERRDVVLGEALLGEVALPDPPRPLA